MTISISTLTDLNTLKRYEGMRDAPRRFLETGVFPNGEQALIAYGRLLEALQGGHEATDEEAVHRRGFERLRTVSRQHAGAGFGICGGDSGVNQRDE